MRTIWFPGIIRYGDVFSMFPFDSTVCSFKILGRDLKKLITIIQNGQKRFYPSWGLQQIFVKSIKNKSLSS
jgi:2',3'-cyclic-nucleotide 2'-phosphodiesterase (5'-nucleotidase family)